MGVDAATARPFVLFTRPFFLSRRGVTLSEWHTRGAQTQRIGGAFEWYGVRCLLWQCGRGAELSRRQSRPPEKQAESRARSHSCAPRPDIAGTKCSRSEHRLTPHPLLLCLSLPACCAQGFFKAFLGRGHFRKTNQTHPACWRRHARAARNVNT